MKLIIILGSIVCVFVLSLFLVKNFHAVNPPIPSSSPVASANSSKNVSLTLSKSEYKEGEQIRTSITNHTTATIYTRDFKTNCSFVELQKHVLTSWKTITNCGMRSQPLLVSIVPGEAKVVILDPKEFTTDLSFKAGSYRVRLSYASDQISANSQEALSKTFVIISEQFSSEPDVSKVITVHTMERSIGGMPPQGTQQAQSYGSIMAGITVKAVLAGSSTTFSAKSGPDGTAQLSVKQSGKYYVYIAPDSLDARPYIMKALPNDNGTTDSAIHTTPDWREVDLSTNKSVDVTLTSQLAMP